MQQRLVFRALLQVSLCALLPLPACLGAECIPLLLIPPENVRNEPDAHHWQPTILELLKHQLQNVSGVRVLPYSAVDYAFRESNLNRDAHLTSKEIRRLAASVSAKRVIAGTFEKNA